MVHMVDYISEVISFRGITNEKGDDPLRELRKFIGAWKRRDGTIKGEIYRSLRYDSDILIWFMAERPEDIYDAKSGACNILKGYEATMGFLSIYRMRHRPKERSGRHNYFVAYPMSKSPEWYLLDEAERKRIIAEHVGIATNSKSNDEIISYTTESFGIDDNEFVLIYELKSIANWVAVTEELRHATARRWVVNERPILTGIRLD